MSGSQPHYMQPIVASLLPDYCNEDSERIRNAFGPGSWQNITALPHNLHAGYAAVMRIDALERQANGTIPMRPTGKAAPLFMEFEYQASPYSLVDEKKAMERQEHLQQQRRIAGDKAFVASGGKTQTNSLAVNMDGKDYDYIPEPFEAMRDEKARQKWLEEKKVIGGPFVPAATAHALNKPTRVMIPEIMKVIYNIVCKDWDEQQPTVFCTEDDLIVVFFRTAGLRSTFGISAYMNTLLNHNTLLSSYFLSKVPEAWNVRTGDGCLMFTLRPSWVIARAFDPAVIVGQQTHVLGAGTDD